jgi:hypothetical protein
MILVDESKEIIEKLIACCGFHENEHDMNYLYTYELNRTGYPPMSINTLILCT